MHLLIHRDLPWPFHITDIGSPPGHTASRHTMGPLSPIPSLPKHWHSSGGFCADMSISPAFVSFLVASPPSRSIHPLLWLHPGLGHFSGMAPLRKSQHLYLPLSHHDLPVLLSPSFIYSQLSDSSVGTSNSLTVFHPTLLLALVFMLIPVTQVHSTVHRFNNSFNFNPIALLSFCHLSQTDPGWFQSPALSAPLVWLLNLSIFYRETSKLAGILAFPL